ncbi:MAG: thioredoxin fold domain-containing protein [Methylococcaceae bacterium]
MTRTDSVNSNYFMSGRCFLISLISLFLFFSHCSYASDDALVFDDTMLEEELVYPEWFKIHFGDLKLALKEAGSAGKKGIIVYFGQKRCAYCYQFMKFDLGNIDIENYVRKNFDVIPIDIWGIEDIIDTDGTVYSEGDFAEHKKATFTPTLIFYDLKGKAVFGLRGFYPPYKFRAALRYVVEGFYTKESFREYLSRAEPEQFFSEGGLNERDFFLSSPYSIPELSKSGKPLAVFFEQGKCHACDLLHGGPMNKAETLKAIEKMNVIQLDMWSDDSVTVFNGENSNAREWAKALDVFHPPTLVFFEPDGREIIRIDSIVQFYRLQGVLDYINRKGYEVEKDYQKWRLMQREM